MKNKFMGMIYKSIYKTPVEYSDMIMYSDGEYLIGLCFKEAKDVNKQLVDAIEGNAQVFEDTKKWLDEYFKGNNPEFTPKYKINNLTEFRQMVIDEMLKISYGKTITYNDIAKSIAKKKNISKMSAQAVGGAVGWNPICLIIPCHRVIGTDGSLTGYGGGIENKMALLKHEKNN